VAEIKTEEENGKVSCDRFGGVSELIHGIINYEKDLPGKLTIPSLFIPIKPALLEDMTHRCTPRNSKMARWPDWSSITRSVHPCPPLRNKGDAHTRKVITP
jgi:hypothetical protein